MQKSLEVLDISGNSLDSIRDLEVLQEISQLVASDNELNDLKEMVNLLSLWRRLRKLDLIGNPMCHKNKYRDRLIISSPNLGKLYCHLYCKLIHQSNDATFFFFGMHFYNSSITLLLSELLDGKEITDLTRVFLKNLQANKDAVKRRRESFGPQNDFGWLNSLFERP